MLEDMGVEIDVPTAKVTVIDAKSSSHMKVLQADFAIPFPIVQNLFTSLFCELRRVCISSHLPHS